MTVRQIPAELMRTALMGTNPPHVFAQNIITTPPEVAKKPIIASQLIPVTKIPLALQFLEILNVTVTNFTTKTAMATVWIKMSVSQTVLIIAEMTMMSVLMTLEPDTTASAQRVGNPSIIPVLILMSVREKIRAPILLRYA
jgi:hypothetical protein